MLNISCISCNFELKLVLKEQQKQTIQLISKSDTALISLFQKKTTKHFIRGKDRISLKFLIFLSSTLHIYFDFVFESIGTIFWYESKNEYKTQTTEWIELNFCAFVRVSYVLNDERTINWLIWNAWNNWFCCCCLEFIAFALNCMHDER